MTLLLLVNFTARILLAVCAWMANPPRPPDPVPDGARRARDGRPELPVLDGDPPADVRHLRAPRHAVESTRDDVENRRDAAEGTRDAVVPSTEEHLRAGHGSHRPWSPLVRGISRRCRSRSRPAIPAVGADRCEAAWARRHPGTTKGADRAVGALRGGAVGVRTRG